jgi:hypothetical protein
MLQPACSAPKHGVAARSRRLAWRYALLGAASPVLPFLLWSCNSHPLMKPTPDPVGETAQYRELNPIHSADILFVVDDSGSMAQEQENLARNFPAFMRELSVPGADLHIAAVTSDLGAGSGSFQANCNRGGGDKGTFCTYYNVDDRTQVASVVDSCSVCSVNVTEGRFLRTINPNFPAGSLENTFTCMARFGTDGCGFEHQLGSLRAALTSPANGAFIRPEAYLAFVVITDEDDCTAPADSTAFTADNPGQDTSLRCALMGHTCGGVHNDGTVDVNRPLEQCEASDDGGLVPVKELADSVLAVKNNDPSKIIAAGIFGWPLPNTTPAPYRIDGRGNGGGFGGGNPTRSLKPICESQGNGEATAGLRVKKFIESFPQRSISSICEGDFSAALRDIGSKIGVLLGKPCVDAPLVDINTGKRLAANMNADSADCAIVERRPRDNGGEDEVVLPRCTAGSTAACWSLASDPTCTASNYRIDIDRKGEEAPPGTKQSIRCLTVTQ